MEGVTPGTYHQDGGSSTVGSMRMGCSLAWLGGGAASGTANGAAMPARMTSNPIPHRHVCIRLPPLIVVSRNVRVGRRRDERILKYFLDRPAFPLRMRLEP